MSNFQVHNVSHNIWYCMWQSFSQKHCSTRGRRQNRSQPVHVAGFQSFISIFQFHNWGRKTGQVLLNTACDIVWLHTWQEEAEWRHSGPYIDFQLHKQPTVLFFVLFLKKKSFLVNVIPITWTIIFLWWQAPRKTHISKGTGLSVCYHLVKSHQFESKFHVSKDDSPCQCLPFWINNMNIDFSSFIYWQWMCEERRLVNTNAVAIRQ